MISFENAVAWIKENSSNLSSYITWLDSDNVPVLFVVNVDVRDNKIKITHHENYDTMHLTQEKNFKLYIRQNKNVLESPMYVTIEGNLATNRVQDEIVFDKGVLKGTLEESIDVIGRIQREIPTSLADLKQYQLELSTKILSRLDSVTLITSVGGRVNTHQIDNMVKIDDSNLLFRASSHHPLLKQLYFNNKFKLLVNLDTEGRNELVEFEGLAEFNSANQKEDVEVVLHITKLSYGTRTNLEQFAFQTPMTYRVSLVRLVKRRSEYWFRVFRAHLFAISLAPVILGSLLAVKFGYTLHLFNFFIALFSVVLIHASANLLNDYFDQSRDNLNLRYTSISSTSKALQSNLMDPSRSLSISITLGTLGGILGFYLVFVTEGRFILFVGVVGIFLALFYSLPPFKLSRLPFSEIFILIAFGPLPVVGSYYLQSAEFSNSFTLILLGILLGIYVVFVVSVNNYLSKNLDEMVGKNTTPTFLSPTFFNLYLFTLFILFNAIIGILVISSDFSLVLLVASIPSIAFLQIIRKIAKDTDKMDETIYVQSLMVYSVGSIFLMISIILDIYM